jgi:hypothetical protein
MVFTFCKNRFVINIGANKMTNTIENAIKNFSNNVGNGSQLGVHYSTVVEHGRSNGDTSPIIKLLNVAIKRGDTSLANTIKFTTGKIWIGAKIESKGGIYTKIKTKGCEVSNSAIDALSNVSGNVSMRSQKWRDAFKTDSDKDTTKERDLIKWANNVKKSGKLEARIAEYKAMIAALEAQRATVSKKKAA